MLRCFFLARIGFKASIGFCIGSAAKFWIMRRMRINLVTPYAEKDAVKALGARWDGARKLWYITDVADITPFMRWIPDLDAATEDTTDTPAQSKRLPTAPSQQSMGVTTNSAVEVPHCGCDVLPWDDCEHTISRRPP